MGHFCPSLHVAMQVRLSYHPLYYRGAPSLVVTPSLVGLARDFLISEGFPEFTEFVHFAYAKEMPKFWLNILNVNDTTTATIFCV